MPLSPASFWDDLLEYIDAQKVIPIIGPELLRVEINGQKMLLHRYLAERLAERLAVDATGLTDAGAINQVICRFMDSDGQRAKTYTRLSAALKELKVEVPEPLRKLAQIKRFKLYVTTTFDSLMQQALNQVRFEGQDKTEVIVYTPSKIADLPGPIAQLDRPVVYHLLGQASATPDFVLTEEDTLEFLYQMQDRSRQPEKLFDELRGNHLLLIGNSFPDWLARFFIRIAKGNRLSTQRDWQEFVADASVHGDKSLVMFLEHFSTQTEVFSSGGAIEFVDELYSRYAARYGIKDGSAPKVETPVVAPTPAGGEMAPGAVFISYASEDLAAVQRIRDALDDRNIDVWFDKAQLSGGDDYNRKIERNIKNCSLFLPVISANTDRRLEGYFRLEWSLAVERSRSIMDEIPFLIPTSIDQIDAQAAKVPEKFRQKQWLVLPDGKPDAKFVTRIQELYRDYQKRSKGVV